MRKCCLFLLLSLYSLVSDGQQLRIVTTDITRFWDTFDAVAKEPDTLKKAALLQQLYLDKGSEGLQAMAKLRNMAPMKFIHSFLRYPAFWATVRSHTLDVIAHTNELEPIFQRYRELYPAFKQPALYFMIGYGGTGGTTTQHEMLIGTEIAAADSTVTTTGMSLFLQNYINHNKGITHLVAHEITHTQQPLGDLEVGRNTNLLGFCMAEGVCDFVAELLLQQELQTPYIHYGKQHEKELWLRFKQELHGQDISKWLYNGGKEGEASDLGYFIGYVICKSYYQHQTDKQAAIKQLLNLPYDDPAALDHFLELSAYNGNFYK